MTEKKKIALFVSDDEMSQEAVAKLSQQAPVVLLSLSPVPFPASSHYQIDLARLDRLKEIIKKEKVGQIGLVGRFPHRTVFSLKQDSSGGTFLQHFSNWQNETLLKGISHWLEKEGVKIMPVIEIFRDNLVASGVLTQRKPTEEEWADIGFGKKVLAALACFNIGQSLTVKNQTVLAIEGLEGTDEMLKRSGQFCQDFVVVKMAGAQKDVRFDLPAIGPKTVEIMAASGGRVLAVEAGRTILINETGVVDFCQQHNLSLVGL